MMPPCSPLLIHIASSGFSPPETQPWRSDDPERLVSLYAPIFSPQCPSVPRLTLIAFCLVLVEDGHRLSGDGERETTSFQPVCENFL